MIRLQKEIDNLRILAAIPNSIHDIIITSDTDFQITHWNDAAEQLLGWKAEEVIGKTATSFLTINYPYQSREQILDAFRKNGYWRGEVIYHTK